MLTIIAAAIRRRPAQAILLFLLAAIAGAGVAAAPGYSVASAQALAVASVNAAQGNEKLVSASTEVAGAPDLGVAIADFSQLIQRQLVLPGFAATKDTRVTATISSTKVTLAYRQDVCAHVVITGSCPAAAGDVVIDSELAATAGIKAGDTVRAVIDSTPQQPNGIALRVTGLYRPIDAGSPYWGPIGAHDNTEDRPLGIRLAGDVLFTPEATVSTIPMASGVASVDFLVTAQSLTQRDLPSSALAYKAAQKRLAPHNVLVESQITGFANRVWDDQQFIYVGVAVAAVQLLLLCWIALFLAIQLTADARRGELGLLKMRGSRRRDLWLLVVGQSTLPMLAGGLVGLLAGVLAARVAVGDVTGAGLRHATWYLAAGAAVLAVLGGVVAAMLAERRSLGEPVTALNRKVVRRRSNWAANAFDGVVVLLAVGGAYEATHQAAEASQLRGLSLIAPVLVALAVGLVAARLVTRVASLVARPALRSGRLGVGLTALNLARRSTLTPVFALLVLVVSVFFGTVLTWEVSQRSTAERAALQTGADRVLTVQADTVAGLLSGVRATDPQGRYAMAAVRSPDLRVLAVDATRLPLAPWYPSYGLPTWSAVAAALHPTAASPYLVRGEHLSLDVTWPALGAGPPVTLAVNLNGDAGPVVARFGPLTAGAHVYQADASGCAAANPCRVANLTLSSGSTGGQIPAGTAATVRELRLAPDGPAVIDRPAFADRTRWRAAITPGAQVPDIGAGTDGLSIGLSARDLATGSPLAAAVYPFDAPSPLPVFAAGARALGGGPGDPRIQPFPSSGAVTVRVAGAATGIPRLGPTGVLMDLDYAIRDVDVAEGGTMEVWLAPDAPADIETALAGHGVKVIATDSLAAQIDTLHDQGPQIALRFVALVALVGVVLGAGAFAVVTTVDRGVRGAEFAALRRQGMRLRLIQGASYGGYLVFVLLAVTLGVATAVSWRALAGDHVPVFSDDWADLPTPAAGALTGAVAAVAVLLVMGAAAWAAAAALVASVGRVRSNA